MEKKSSASFVSLSAFLHALVMLGLVALPAMKLLPEESGGGDSNVEIVTESGKNSPIEATTTATTVNAEPAAEAIATPPAPPPQPEVAAPVPVKKTVKKVAAKTLPKKVAKKVIQIDATENTNDDTIAAQEEESKTDQEIPVATEEIAEEKSQNEDQVIDNAAEAAAAEAVANQQIHEEQNEKQNEALAAPKTQPAVEKLSDIPQAGNGGVEQSGSTDGLDIGSMAGPSGEELRSYLELKQLSGNKPPQYPGNARRMGQQGQVLLHYFVTAQGKVKDVRVAKSSGFTELDNEAIRAASKFNFVAGQEGWTAHSVVFSLKGVAAPASGRLRTAGSSSNRQE